MGPVHAKLPIHVVGHTKVQQWQATIQKHGCPDRPGRGVVSVLQLQTLWLLPGNDDRQRTMATLHIWYTGSSTPILYFLRIRLVQREVFPLCTKCILEDTRHVLRVPSHDTTCLTTWNGAGCILCDLPSLHHKPKHQHDSYTFTFISANLGLLLRTII